MYCMIYKQILFTYYVHNQHAYIITVNNELYDTTSHYYKLIRKHSLHPPGYIRNSTYYCKLSLCLMKQEIFFYVRLHTSLFLTIQIFDRKYLKH